MTVVNATTRDLNIEGRSLKPGQKQYYPAEDLTITVDNCQRIDVEAGPKIYCLGPINAEYDQKNNRLTVIPWNN